MKRSKAVFRAGDFVVVKPVSHEECPTSSAVARCTGIIEALCTDVDGDTAALVYFGFRHPLLRSDSAWIYLERLEYLN